MINSAVIEVKLISFIIFKLSVIESKSIEQAMLILLLKLKTFPLHSVDNDVNSPSFSSISFESSAPLKQRKDIFPFHSSLLSSISFSHNQVTSTSVLYFGLLWKRFPGYELCNKFCLGQSYSVRTLNESGTLAIINYSAQYCSLTF